MVRVHRNMHAVLQMLSPYTNLAVSTTAQQLNVHRKHGARAVTTYHVAQEHTCGTTTPIY